MARTKHKRGKVGTDSTGVLAAAVSKAKERASESKKRMHAAKALLKAARKAFKEARKLAKRARAATDNAKKAYKRALADSQLKGKAATSSAAKPGKGRRAVVTAKTPAKTQESPRRKATSAKKAARSRRPDTPVPRKKMVRVELPAGAMPVSGTDDSSQSDSATDAPTPGSA